MQLKMTPFITISPSSRRLWAGDADLSKQQQHGHGKGLWGILALAWASIGVIYGDIGTSPLYVYSTIFSNRQPTQQDVLCATSLIFWSITLVVLLKYVFIVLLADDNGEGGTFALYAMISRACGIPAVNAGTMPADKQLFESVAHSVAGSSNSIIKQLKVPGQHGGHDCPEAAAAHKLAGCDGQGCSHGHGARLAKDVAPLHHIVTAAAHPPVHLSGLGAWLHHQFAHNRTAQKVLLGLTLLMTAMVLGDGVLTPSISVLSAVSGLQVKAGLNSSSVIGITCAILVLLFGIQSWGTQRVGIMFAPTVALWFLSNVLVGTFNICMFEGGSIFRALSPHYIGVWFQTHGTEGWLNMAGVFLCLTGCEAMFADMGHFNRQSIQLSFVFGVYPSLILTYLGQASWLMHNLDGYGAVFYNSLPKPVFWPIFVVSVLASIGASQALITGAFSIVNQCMAMGCFPRFKVQHTSQEVGGQVYIPEVNYTLLVLCIAVVAGFRSGTAIGNAYGIAVNMVMLSTVFLVSLVMLVAWGTHPLLVLAFFLPFAFIEGVFLSANILNIPNGGWFSITLAVVLSATNSLWIWGTAQKNAALQREQFQLTDLITTKPPNWHQPGFGMASQSWRLYRVCNSAPVHRNPGMALVYSETPFQVPAVFKRLVESWGVHSIVVFLTVRQVPVPHVCAQERLLLAPLEFRGFYRCVARYGYMDKVDQGEQFAQAILDKIAEVMPSHAMADCTLSGLRGRPCSQQPPEDGTHGATMPPHSSHEGVKRPPSIAEEPASPGSIQPGGLILNAQTGSELIGSHHELMHGNNLSVDGGCSSYLVQGSSSSLVQGSSSALVQGSSSSLVKSSTSSLVQGSSSSLVRSSSSSLVQGSSSTASSRDGSSAGPLGIAAAAARHSAHTGPPTAAAAADIPAGQEQQQGAMLGMEDVSHAASLSDGLWSDGSGQLSGIAHASLALSGVEVMMPAGGVVGSARRSEYLTMPGPQPLRRTTWEARRTLDGDAAISELAQHAVYVLHRSIIHVRPKGSKAECCVRKFLIEVVYQQLWQLTTRFWEGWKVPASRMFEVGMVVEI